MRLSREVTFGEGANALSVTVFELTVGDIRNWLRDLESLDKGDLVDAGLFDDLTLAELERMTDLAMSTIDELPPSQIDELIAVAKELNPRFFALRGRLVEAGRQLQTSSSAPSAPSSETATQAPGITR